MWKFALIVPSLSAHLTAQDVEKSDGDRSRILALENAWNQAVREKIRLRSSYCWDRS